jgi:4-diphosphocytidyl-2C-methyl-D-erythritol kinase
MYVKASAKINLYLDVLGKRENGYHDLDMVMLPLELHDTLNFEHVPSATYTHIISDTIERQIIDNNLVYRTHELLKTELGYKPNFIVRVHREMPFYAGMGAGSANAAAALKYLLKFGKVKLSEEEQLKLALKLGADVPFSMKNVPAHVEGIGEKVTPIKVKKQYFVVVIKPKQGLSTKVVFQESDKVEMKHGNVQDVIKALETGNDTLLAKSVFNSLEETSIKLCPEIAKIKEMMKKDGFKVVLMTGSGSCVFAMTTNYTLALSKYLKYEHKGYEVYMTKTLKSKIK